MGGKDYSDFLTRPVWPKAHHTKLQDRYEGSSQEALDNESAGRSNHRPGGSSVSLNGRKAGTSSGNSGYVHPDDFAHRDLEELLKRHAGISEAERKGLSNICQDTGKPEKIREDFKKLLADPKIVISARDVKKLTPDFKIQDGHNKAHGHARYALPITESELKAQNWEGKEKQERKKKEAAEQKKKEQDEKDGKSTDDGDKKEHDKSEKSGGDKQEEEKKGGVSQANQKTNREQDPGVEEGASTDDMSPAERRFMDALVEEANAVKAFTNATGEPGPPSDPDGTDQVGIEIQTDDQFTPDNWIPRSSHLLRLTGKHPLNAEADLRELFEAGMQTPVKLHYVRNHGSVPQLTWETHTLEVYSDPPDIVSKPREFSMQDLSEMPAIELAVTIACDGNRRGEVNMIKRSAGFTWSSSGVSTCKWKGVLVKDLLERCGLAEQPAGERWYLNYEGADDPSEGKYATSIPLAHAMNPQNDVMLAYGINGRVLAPDHGYPLRSVIPGYVGGRQVKWLKKLWITKKPNESHYHIWDNRVVPSFITDKNTIEGKAFFHHPDTACNNQILQSVVCRPSHGEAVPITLQEAEANPNITTPEEADPKDPLAKLYRMQGYAYNGGGNIVERVELSLDGGKNWRYCFRKFADSPLRHGEKSWVWVFWHCDVEIRELCQATEIIVRAFDAYKNTQPEHVSWNFMGMMNNAWYRLRLHTDVDLDSKQPALLFQHPVAPGGKEGGWMKLSPEQQAKEEASQNASNNVKEYTLEEVEKHNTDKDCWIILNNKVYDATSVLAWHPGGAAAISNYAGKATAQATADYNAVHDGYAQKKTEEVLVGKLSAKGIQTLQEDQKKVDKKQVEQKQARKDYALKPFQYLPATLLKRKEISKDTRLYTFKLPDVNGKTGKLGLPVCRHVQIASHWLDGVVMRPYTPTRPVLPEEEDGTFDLLIKTYLPESSPFPPGGTLGNYLDVLKEGETIDINGPTGEISYLGQGKFEIEGTEYTFTAINLVAGGTGITPHWQLIHAILKKDDDKTRVSLIDSNKTVEDVLLKDELQKYADDHPDQFKLWHTLSTKPEDQEWKYSVGHLDEGMMNDHFFKPDGDKVATFLCGPPGLIEHGAMPALKTMGFEEGKTCFGF